MGVQKPSHLPDRVFFTKYVVLHKKKVEYYGESFDLWIQRAIKILELVNESVKRQRVTCFVNDKKKTAKVVNKRTW